jgi:thiamine biosynthesis lipoprotein
METVPDKEWVFEAIGTRWQITLPTLPEEEAEEVMPRALARIAQFDQTYSRFREDSMVSDMARGTRVAGTYQLPEDAQQIMDLYEHLYEVTGGKFTPLIGQALSDAGYDAAYTLRAGTLSIPPAWHDVLDYSFPTLTLKQPALLDFGAAGKGYLVDIIAEYFKGKGINSFTINAGGDIRYEDKDGTPLRVGLEHPDDPTQVIGVAAITSGSICGSAGNRRAWGEFTHILDPDTLTSPKHLKACYLSVFHDTKTSYRATRGGV